MSNQAQQPISFRRPPRLAALLALAMFVSALQMNAQPPPEFPARIGDFAVLVDEQAVTRVFATDLQGDGIYASEASGRESLEAEELRHFFSSPAYRRPAALATGGGKLVIAYQEPPALVAVDLAGTPSVLWEGAPLTQPLAVAVFDNGIIVVADAGRPGLFRLCEEGDEGEGNRRWTVTPFGEEVAVSDRLVAAGQELLVRERASGAVLSFDIATLERKSRVWGKSWPETVQMADFAFRRGIFYASDAERLQVFSRTEEEVFEAPFARGGHLSRLIATQDDLFALDRDAGRIWRWPRPVPSVVKLEGGVAHAIQSLPTLALNLMCRELLTAREFEVKGQAITVGEALVMRGLFPGRRSDDKASLVAGARQSRPAPEDRLCGPEARLSSTQALAGIVCHLNPQLCPEGEQGAKKVLSKTLQPGENLVAPDLEVRSYLMTRYVDLSRRQVSKHLAERIPSEELRKTVDAAYISGINPALLRTPESVLTRNGFIQATPPHPKLGPGTVLQFKKGLDSVDTRLTACSQAIRMAVVPGQTLKVPRPIVGDLSSHLVPGSAGSERELAKWEVDQVELTFDEAVVERLDPARLESLLLEGAASNCSGWGRDAGNHLIVEALKLRGSRYRFLRRDGSVVFPSPEELTNAKIVGSSGKEDGWSLAVEEPLYIGYRLLPWEPEAPGSGWTLQASMGDPSVKPESPQDILTRSSGRLNLPVEAWRTSALLPVGALGDREAYFPGIASDKSDLILLSTEDLLLEAHAIAMQESPVPQPVQVVPPALWDELLRSREQLYKVIHYDPKSLPSPGLDLIVGVAENRAHIDFDHPDFMGDDGNYAWVEVAEDGHIQPILHPASANVPAPQVRDFAAADHGTHVAGLIGARRGRLGPGLLPYAELLLLDTSNAARFHDSIRAAATRGEVSVLNFSFSYSRRDAADELLKIMNSPGVANLLFVVAAGNDGEELGAFERFPVCWVDKIANMVGVGASNWTGELMNSWIGPGNSKQKGSNFGAKYVQILAPGFEIYSNAAANGYAKQSGTSQAAPLVTGVAALLAQDLTNPDRVKARLIYTADWNSLLKGQSWGGLLNVERALRHHNLNLVWTQTEPQATKSIFFKRNPESITLRGGEFYDQTGEITNMVRTVPFRNILRITLGDDGLFRVMYLEEESRRLRVLLDTRIEGKLQCERFQKWEDVKFVDTAECQNGFDVANIQDYVAKTPRSVRF